MLRNFSHYCTLQRKFCQWKATPPKTIEKTVNRSPFALAALMEIHNMARVCVALRCTKSKLSTHTPENASEKSFQPSSDDSFQWLSLFCSIASEKGLKVIPIIKIISIFDELAKTKIHHGPRQLQLLNNSGATRCRPRRDIIFRCKHVCMHAVCYSKTADAGEGENVSACVRTMRGAWGTIFALPSSSRKLSFPSKKETLLWVAKRVPN